MKQNETENKTKIMPANNRPAPLQPPAGLVNCPLIDSQYTCGPPERRIAISSAHAITAKPNNGLYHESTQFRPLLSINRDIDQAVIPRYSEESGRDPSEYLGVT
jgi:hypothetical protein